MSNLPNPLATENFQANLRIGEALQDRRKRKQERKRAAEKEAELRQKIRQCFRTYCIDIFPHVYDGQELAIEPHHEYMMQMAQKMTDEYLKSKKLKLINPDYDPNPLNAIISMPPRHGKSEIIQKLFSTWLVGKISNFGALITSYSKDAAIQNFGADIIKILKSQRYQAVMTKYARGEAASGRYFLKNGSYIYLDNVTQGAVTGQGFGYIVVDDPFEGHETAQILKMRNKIYRAFNKHLLSRFNDDSGFFVVVMTRWHLDDLVGRLKRDIKKAAEKGLETFRVWEVNFPALAGKDDPLGRKPGTALWRAIAGEKRLKRLRQQQGEAFFEANYQGNPTPDGGMDIKRDMIKFYDNPDILKKCNTYAAFDYAFGGQNSDMICFMVFGIGPDRNIYIHPDIIWAKYADDKLKDEIINIYQRNQRRGLKIRRIIGEKMAGAAQFWRFYNKSFRKEAIKIIRHDIATNQDKLTGNKSETGKQVRFKWAQTMMQRPSNTILLPSPKVFAAYNQKNWLPDAIDEMIKFPRAVNDDFVDCLSLIGLSYDDLLTRKEEPEPAQLAGENTFDAIYGQDDQIDYNEAVGF